MSRTEADDLLREISVDKVHGADYLGDRAVMALARFAETNPAESPDALRSAMWGYAGELARVRPSMAPLVNKVATMMNMLPVNVALDELREAASDASERLVSGSASRRRRLVSIAVEELRGVQSVFTYSSSSTVMDILVTLRPSKITVTEGRPLYEGRKVAEQLASLGLEVTFTVDAAMATCIGEADAVLVGADSVLHGGGFVNKVGSMLLALAARERGVPLYVAADTMKLDVAGYLGRRLVLEEKEPEEVWRAPQGVRVLNPYFEETPGELVSMYITERGLMRPGELSGVFEEMASAVKPLIL